MKIVMFLIKIIKNVTHVEMDSPKIMMENAKN